METEIIAHEHVLLEAARRAGLSANAIESQNLTGLAVPQGCVRWPSYFVDKTGFVQVLAYLVTYNLPYQLEVAPYGQAAAQRFKLHPPLDPHTLELLREIDPSSAAAMEEMRARAERVFERLSHAAIGEAGADDG